MNLPFNLFNKLTPDQVTQSTEGMIVPNFVWDLVKQKKIVFPYGDALHYEEGSAIRSFERTTYTKAEMEKSFAKKLQVQKRLWQKEMLLKSPSLKKRKESCQKQVDEITKRTRKIARKQARPRRIVPESPPPSPVLVSQEVLMEDARPFDIHCDENIIDLPDRIDEFTPVPPVESLFPDGSALDIPKFKESFNPASKRDVARLANRMTHSKP